MRCGFALTVLPKDQDPVREAQTALENQLPNMVDTKLTPSNEYGSFKGSGWIVQGQLLDQSRSLQWRFLSLVKTVSTPSRPACVSRIDAPNTAFHHALSQTWRSDDHRTS